MDNVTVITIASIVVANIGTTILLFTWATNHAAQDNRENRALIKSAEENTKKMIDAIHTEMKDFHERLIRIEERNKSHLVK